MRLQNPFELTDLPVDDRPDGDFSPIPAGDYQVSIVSADMVPTKAGTGMLLKIRYDVIGPTHAKRVIFGQLNIQNPSAKAEEIGRLELRKLMSAVGLQRFEDTDQFVGAPLTIKVAIETSENYPAKNVVKGWKSIGGESALPMPAMAAAPATKSATPPWAKK
tara:strand:- start:433 stop:918 length:486 start_codon:yes stop_codon:yes gene_type:complete